VAVSKDGPHTKSLEKWFATPCLLPTKGEGYFARIETRPAGPLLRACDFFVAIDIEFAMTKGKVPSAARDLCCIAYLFSSFIALSRPPKVSGNMRLLDSCCSSWIDGV